MDVEITVKVDGRLVKRHVEDVGGTFEQMEEAIHALSRRVAVGALQAGVDQQAASRPLFRKAAGAGGIAGTARDG